MKKSIYFVPPRYILKCAISQTLRSSSYLTLNHKPKIFDSFPICGSQEWTSIFEETKTVLLKKPLSPKYAKKRRAPLASVDVVVNRLRRTQCSSDHLINTFRHLLEDKDSAPIRWPGLVTLMLAQVVGNPFTCDNFVSNALADVVWSSQLTLAEVVNLLHCNVVFQQERQKVATSKRIADVGSREVGRLVSNYLTSSVLSNFGTLNNCKVAWLISSVLESIAKSCLSYQNINSRHLGVHYTLESWEQDVFQPLGLLIANGCLATTELAGHDQKTQEMAFAFGRYLAYAIQANSDIQQYLNYQSSLCSSFNLNSLPAVMHISNNPETLLHVYSSNNNMENIDIDELNSMIKSSSAIEDSKRQLSKYLQETMSILMELGNKNNHLMEYLIRLIKTLGNISDK